MLFKRRKSGKKYTSKIEHYIIEIALRNAPKLKTWKNPVEYLGNCKNLFNQISETVQHVHIKQQVHKATVNESVGNYTIIFFSMRYLVGIENEFRKHIAVLQSNK